MQVLSLLLFCFLLHFSSNSSFISFYVSPSSCILLLLSLLSRLSMNIRPFTLVLLFPVHFLLHLLLLRLLFHLLLFALLHLSSLYFKMRAVSKPSIFLRLPYPFKVVEILNAILNGVIFLQSPRSLYTLVDHILGRHGGEDVEW